MKARITAAWNKWREVSGVVADRRMPRKLKVKIYETVVRPVMMYGGELWTMRKAEERLFRGDRDEDAEKDKGSDLARPN